MGKFEEAYRQLNDQQRQAVDAIDGPVLVIAGPGTGKTQLLTTRVANILDKTDTLPETIVCLTFTDSAAHTMRERLAAMIGKAAYNITITTYHAFGSELIRRYPEYFTNSAELEPADDLVIDSIFRNIQNQLPYSNPLKFETYLRDVKTLVSDCKRALLSPDDVRKIADANEAFRRSADKLVQKHLSGFVRIDKSVVPHFLELAKECVKLPPTHPLPAVVPLVRLWEAQLLDALAAFDDTGKTTQLTKWKNNWLARDEAGKLTVAGRDQTVKLRAGAVIYEHYLAELAHRGLYDYDDMILRAIRGLETHAELRYSLQERYQYLLLDEYQDTNEAQARLVELLTDNPASEGRPNVLAVGDDDQAIYAFQGASYSHMLSFYEHYRDVLVVPLTKNYRSHPDILQLSEGVAEQIEHRLHHNFPSINKTISSAGDVTASPGVVQRYEFKSDLSQNAWIAKHAKQLVEQGTPASDIAVLAPKHEYLEALVPFLHHAGLPVHYEKRENVLEDPAVVELITMSRLALALAQHNRALADTLWAQVLSLPLWELPTSLVWQLSWQASDSHSSWTDLLQQHKETKPIALFFIGLSQLAARAPLEEMMDYVIGITPLALREKSLPEFRSPYYDHYFGPLLGKEEAVNEFWQLLSNLTVIRHHLRDYRAYEHAALTLHDFVDFVEASRAADIKIINTNPYQEATEAVELMTAYKAKGREFAAVFIMAAIDEVWGSKARAMGSRLSLPENLRFIRYAGTTEDERLRLLYVALTRAKTQLYLTSYTGTYSGRLTTRLKYLDESVQEDATLRSPLLPKADQTVHQPDQAVPELPELTLYWHHRHHQAVKEPSLKSLLAPRLENFQLSATELNCFLDTRRDGPHTFFAQSLLRFPAAPTMSGEYGSAIHEILQWVHHIVKTTGTLPPRPRIYKEFERRLRAKRLGQPHTELLIARGRAVLKTYFAERSNTIAANDVVEHLFRREAVFVGKAHLTGKIDKLVINRHQKTITIIDYKTGKAYRRWANEPKLHFYRHQLYFYKLLVERSRSFAAYRVEDAYLEFVEPDESGQIRDLHLSFDPAYAAHFERLIETVWSRIQNLEFPDVSDYSPSYSGIINFENDLLKNFEAKK